MPSTPTFADNMKVLREETERITAYLAALPAESWTHSTACDAWQVRDVVAHLVGVAEFYAGNVTRGLQGDTAPPAGRPPAGSVTAAMSAEGVAKRAIAEREKLGDRVLEQFRAANAHLIDVLGALNPESQTILCYHPGGMTQAQQFIDLRLKELAVHEWDIRSCLEPSASLSAASLPIGTRLRVGAALVEVTPKPHNGCRKFKARFGQDALFCVQAPETRSENRRGIYWKVVEAGRVRVGDRIDVLRGGR